VISEGETETVIFPNLVSVGDKEKSRFAGVENRLLNIDLKCKNFDFEM
jgi:hypothetical protein